MNAPSSLICLAGVSGAGKDTLGAYLAKQHGFERVALADPIKAALMGLLQLDPAQLWGDRRNEVDPRFGRAPRELYQRFGQACLELDPEVWLRPFRMRFDAIRRAGGRVVCTDLRTQAEWRAAREMGATIWLIERPGAGAPGALSRHATEMELLGLDRSSFDAVLRNDGTPDALYLTVKHMLEGAVGSRAT
ncbi:hypothetical protein D7X96_09500 [Corallococcus interemptor]|uniref:Deoxynucleotide monophosphate kinase n=1 Tax=Corallococcus interemptor TaxID=2316720 RepID=A0A3A8QVN6_9BACT|nr:hypothetical protein [Corallococcus interemptor]RKH71010.1 hypothetical protein D7X96_09500 [Corallococcus interemptor]